MDAFKVEVNKNTDKIRMVQDMNYSYNLESCAILEDVRLEGFSDKYGKNLFDFLVTSPPYATALPYIDTQRLSSVWLNLIDAKNIRYYERLLIGTRELTKIQLKQNVEKLHTNTILPKEVIDFCLYLEKNLSKDDGFRRQAIPYLLYNYFYDMFISLKNLQYILKRNGYFCLILGKNRTRIGGKETIIDTPYFLSLISQKVGYSLQELIPLETYQRYEIHLKNSIDQETLIVLQKK